MVRKVEFVDPKCNEFRKGNHIKNRPSVTLTHILIVTIILVLTLTMARRLCL